MNTRNLFVLLLPILICFSIISFAQEGYTIQQVPFNEVKIKDSFWSPWLRTHVTSTLPACIAQIRDSTDRISNFEKAAAMTQGGKRGVFKGLFFDDSDVYKVMEGMAYSLQNNPDPNIEKILDYWIEILAMAQQPDGYLYTFYILDRDKDYWPQNGKWTDIGRHEMYTGGHMLEAAIAYYKATGKRKFLDIAQRYADSWLNLFGPGKRHWVEGHQEPELALVKLYHVTNEKKYLDFAHWLLEERGHGYEFGPMWESNPKSNIDILADVPVKDITDIKGHAVRAMYMFTGMADVSANLHDTTYLPALHRVWDDVVLRNMYITGGIGSSNTNEGFIADYDLPNKTSYCETCSSIGMVFWNNRMSLLTGESKYANIMEKVMYNAALAGVSLSGDKFFYVNPHESDGAHRRSRWHGCACCPTNVARYLPSIGNYVYMLKNDELFVNLFVGSETSLKLGGIPVVIEQKTAYPWEGKVAITVKPESAVEGKIKVRIPDWCKSYTATLNGKKIAAKTLEMGYLTLNKKWESGDMITLDMSMPVELKAADPNVKADIGRRAIQRGPMIYCAEQVDNPGIDLDKMILSSKNKFTVIEGDGILKGIKKLQTRSGKDTITFVPYYAWENREPGKMLVWAKFSK